MSIFDCVPAQLKAFDNWVVWRYEERQTAKGPKQTKVPYNPNSGYPASVTNPEHWSSFDAACSILAAHPELSGIGFVLTKHVGITFIDLDQPGDAQAHAWILANVPGYVEWSPSGKGLHVLTRGRLTGKGHNNRQFGVEIYDTERFFTVTGNVYEGRNEIKSATPEALQFVYDQTAPGAEKREAGGATVAASEPQRDDDTIVVQRAMNARNGEKFKALWQGSIAGYTSHSEADLALANFLAVYTKNHVQFTRLFRMSGLGQRDKAQRDSYIADLIRQAYDAAPLVKMDGIMGKLAAMANDAAQKEERRIAAMREALAAKQAEKVDKADMEIHSNRAGTAARKWLFETAPPYSVDDAPPAPPGMLGEVAGFIHSAAPYPNKLASIIGSLAFFAGLCGRAYNVDGTGLNLYLLFIGPSGLGKEAIGRGIGKLVDAAATLVVSDGDAVPAIRGVIGPDNFDSAKGILTAFAKQKSMLCLWGEVWHHMGRMSGAYKTDATSAGITRMLLELYTKSGANTWVGGSSAAKAMNNTDKVRSPSLTLVGESTDGIYNYISDEILRNGVLPRFLLLETTEYSHDYNRQHSIVVPAPDLSHRISLLAQYAYSKDEDNKPEQVGYTPEAFALLDAYRAQCRVASQHHTGNDAELWTRAHVNAMKVAALVAIGRNYQQPEIDENDALWAMRVVNTSITRIVKKYDDGEIGLDDSRVVANIKHHLGRYMTLPAEALPQRHLVNGLLLEQRTQSIITQRYLRAMIGTPKYLKEGQGGPVATFERAVRMLEGDGVLVPVPNKTGRIWTIHL